MQFDTNAVKPAKIRREKFKKSLQQPGVLYPAGLGVLAIMALVLFSNPIALTASVVAGIIAGGAWLWEYFGRGETHASRYLAKVREHLQQQRQQAISALKEELVTLNAQQGNKQLSLFQAKFENFQTVLNRKLTASELTYNRYMATAEQVYLNGLDNLEKISLALKSVSAIDVTMLDKNISEHSDSSSEAYRHMVQRRQLFNQQQARVKQLYTENEGALTKLDLVSSQLANTDFSSGKATMDMDQAMSDLTRLIESSESYSVN